jgi:hypothetical protein
MKRIVSGLLVAAVIGIVGFLGTFGGARAQTPATVKLCQGTPTCVPVSSSAPLQVAGTFSATIAGFAPGLAYASLTATGSSASVALPAGTVVMFQNTGTTTVSCTLGVGSAVATAGMNQVPASSTVPMVVGSNTFGACIDESGSVSNVVRLSGGSGLASGFGGGGGGGGGSSSITTWGGGTLGAMANYGTSPGAVLVPGMNAFVTSSALPTGGSTSANQASEIAALGTTTDAVAATPASAAAASLIAVAKAINNNVAAAIPAGTNLIGDVNLRQGGTALSASNPSFFRQTDGTTAQVTDPCQGSAKVYTPINVVTATNTIITGVAAKKKYVCGIFLYPAGTQNVAIFQATTGTACTTALVAVIGGTTTATGMIMTAQAGFVLGNGISAVAATTVNQTDLCIVTSASVQLSGVVVTVDQ